MPNTFSYNPSYSSELDYTPRILAVQYGDGYVQESPDGINNEPLVYNLVWLKIPDVDRDAIVTFVKNNSTLPFYWTPPTGPFESQKLFKCRSCKVTYVESNASNVSLVFEQTFQPT